MPAGCPGAGSLAVIGCWEVWHVGGAGHDLSRVQSCLYVLCCGREFGWRRGAAWGGWPSSGHPTTAPDARERGLEFLTCWQWTKVGTYRMTVREQLL